MKRKAEKENDQEGPTMKKARQSLVAVLSDQNHQHEKDKVKHGRSITKVLGSLNADVRQDYGKLLYNFLPGDQRKKGAEMAAFSFFIMERHEIFVQKSSKEKKLLRESLFQEKFFTNIYREADTGTKYIRRKILARYEVGDLTSVEVQDIVFMTASYRLVNRIQTFEDFGRHWGLGNLEQFKDFLDQRKEEGIAIFTHAHNTMGRERLKTCLDDLSEKIEDITTDLLAAATLEECVDVFRAFNNIDVFFAWQIVCDLLELNVLKQDENSWVVLGPGARAGLARIFSGVTSSAAELHYTKWLSRVLPYCFKALELDFVTFLEKKLSMKHVEHGLCEYEKYFRLAAGESQGGRIYRPRERSSVRQCALCESPDDLVEEISPWVLCSKCAKIEARRRNNSAITFVWEEEAQERFKIRRVTINVKNHHTTAFSK